MKTKSDFTYIGSCVSMPEYYVSWFDDNSTEITYDTFRRNVGMVHIKEFNDGVTVKIKNDYHVRYFKFNNIYCIKHSGIHHFYEKPIKTLDIKTFNNYVSGWLTTKHPIDINNMKAALHNALNCLECPHDGIFAYKQRQIYYKSNMYKNK